MKRLNCLIIVFITISSLIWCNCFVNDVYAQYDIYIKDNQLDDGSVPTYGPYWFSPDIWIRNDGECDQIENQKPVPGTVTTVCVRIRNRMVTDVGDITLNTYWADAGPPLFWPASWNFITSFIIPLLSGNSETVNPFSWEVPSNVQELGLLIRADAPDDPLSSGPDTVVPADNVENNNNIAQRNVSLKPNILFSPDIPNTLGDNLFVEGDIISYDINTGSSLHFSYADENIDACGLFEDYIVFSIDRPIEDACIIDEFLERDLFGWNPVNFICTFFLDGESVGIPDGADIDASMILPNGWIVFSLDIPTVLGGIPFSHNDLILWDGASIDLFFRGSDVGIPEEANIDGIFIIEDIDEDGIPTPGSGFGAEVLFSLDIPTDINGLAVTEKDIIRCGQPPCSKYNDYLSSALSGNVDVDAFAYLTDNCPEDPNPAQQDLDRDGLGDPCDECTDTDEDGYGNPGFPNGCGEDNCPEHHNPEQVDTYPPQRNGCGDVCECEGNFDGDEDQDGSDAFSFKEHFGRSPFGNPCIPANPCNGNFNCDEDVDGSDAFIFKEDFGRSPFGNPCPNCVTVPWCE